MYPPRSWNVRSRSIPPIGVDAITFVYRLVCSTPALVHAAFILEPICSGYLSGVINQKPIRQSLRRVGHIDGITKHMTASLCARYRERGVVFRTSIAASDCK